MSSLSTDELVLNWDVPITPGKCHGWYCQGVPIRGDIYCYKHKSVFACAVKDCTEQTHCGNMTCRRHTILMQKMGVNPERMMPQASRWIELRSPMDNNDFRFSASYASRYNNCHGSANLTEAIPGFEHPERNNDGMKGEGTRLHKIFELAVRNYSALSAAAALLREIAGLWGPRRTEFLEQDEKKYLISYFMKHKTPPPLELPDLREGLLQYKQVIDPDGNAQVDESGNLIFVAAGVPPRRIIHLAESMEYVADLISTMDAESLEVFVEEKVKATWLVTEPYTTVDLIIRDKNGSHIMDLKMGDIEVSVINNEQLMYYGQTFRRGNEPMTLHIMQRGATDHWEVPMPVLDAWADKVKASEAAIMSGDLTLVAGSHCKFCPANPHGRGDKGTKACPVMMEVLYGARDRDKADEEVLEGDDFDED
ncbi:Cas4 family exonuclease [Microbacterium phage Zhengyi]|nr:Cas4 family exonuclease [Microbacterium phage Zhengyi]